MRVLADRREAGVTDQGLAFSGQAIAASWACHAGHGEMRS
jgi:hypothetical protein